MLTKEVKDVRGQNWRIAHLAYAGEPGTDNEEKELVRTLAAACGDAPCLVSHAGDAPVAWVAWLCPARHSRQTFQTSLRCVVEQAGLIAKPANTETFAQLFIAMADGARCMAGTISVE